MQLNIMLLLHVHGLKSILRGLQNVKMLAKAFEKPLLLTL